MLFRSGKYAANTAMDGFEASEAAIMVAHSEDDDVKSALVRLQEISEGRIALQDSDREFASFKISNNFSMGNIFGKIVSSAYSRRREFAADKLAAEITEPAYMKSALVRLQEISKGRIALQDSDREFASFKITNNFSMGNLANLFAL